MKKLSIILSIIIVTLAVFSIAYEQKDIPYLCNINEVSLNLVNYIDRYSPYSRYTIFLLLKRGRDKGEELSLTLDQLQLTEKEKEKIIKFMEDEQ